MDAVSKGVSFLQQPQPVVMEQKLQVLPVISVLVHTVKPAGPVLPVLAVGKNAGAEFNQQQTPAVRLKQP
jgi:hypothetical protein